VSYNYNEQDIQNLNQLSELIRNLHSKGHNPATSGNYSLRSSIDTNLAFVSESGIDKSIFTKDCFIPMKIDSKEKDLSFANKKPSDETEVHLTILENSDAFCVLHSHMLEALWFADMNAGKAFADIKYLELLKGFSGVKTHETIIQIPIFENTQDIKSLAESIKFKIDLDPNCYGILLAGHGIYVWGKSIEEAKRHLEVFEYVFKYYLGKR
jgi:methylthioribulose-1-phosphate dehydratase